MDLTGTHVLWAAHVDKYKTDEITLAAAVVPSLRKDMLCLADRFFPAYDWWGKAAPTGTDLLWRVRKNARLEVDTTRRFLRATWVGWAVLPMSRTRSICGWSGRFRRWTSRTG